MKAAIQRFQGMVVEQDAKVKQAQDALASSEQAVLVAKRNLAEAQQIAADYRQAMAVLRVPQIVPVPGEVTVTASDEGATSVKRKRA